MSSNQDPLAALRADIEADAGGGPVTDSVPRRQTGGSRTRIEYYRRNDPSVRQYVEDAGSVGAFAHGAADTVTFGFLDEAGAVVDTYLPAWMGGRGGTYEENLARNRAILQTFEESNGGTYLSGQLLGGFVPILGWGGRAKAAWTASSLSKGTRGMAIAGATQGAIYGFGSGEGDIYDRLRNAATGGIFGGVGGYVLGATVIPALRTGAEKVHGVLFRQGRTPRFDVEITPSRPPNRGDAVVEDLTAVRDEVLPNRTPRNTNETPNAAPAANRADDPLANLSDELDEDAILTPRDLYSNVEDARKKIMDRVSKMTPQQAQRWAQRLEDAELDGNQLLDPHYRSLARIGLDATDVDPETALRAATLMEEATEAVLEKAGMINKTVKQTDAEMRRRYGDTITEKELDEAVERVRQATTDGRVGRHVMMLAGLQFVRAKDRLLPEIASGNREARAELADELTRAIRLAAKGRAIVSGIGRALGDMSKNGKLAFAEVKDDVVEIESASAIKARVDSALRELSDSDLTELVSRLRTMDDLGRVEEILLNADAAKHFSAWRRTFNSLGLFIKSNSLTPASGLFNTIGFITHDFFRNHMAKRWAAKNFQLNGKHDEALKLRFELAVGNAVYWEAHKRGLKAMFQRLKWEALDSVEKIAAVGYGSGKAALRASASKQAMIADGYRAPEVREFEKTGRAAVTDIRGFNQKLERYRTDGGALSTLLYHANKAGAVALNTVDTLGTATARVISGGLDDWGREFVKVKETYALSARQAINEALELGLPEDELVKYAQRRSVELAEMPPTEVLERVEQRLLKREDIDDELKFVMERDLDVEKEANRVLFMDGPQTDAGRTLARAAEKIDHAVSFGTVQGMLMTYIKTPTRIFERGFVSYTPWGAKADEVKQILAKGGVEAEIEKARMELGAFVMGLGAAASFSGAMVVTNGGWKSSSNLENAPPNRIELPGGGFFEIGRLDPFALTLAYGGILGQAMRSYRENSSEYEAQEAWHTAANVAYLALRDAFLEKSYMTGLRDFLKGISDDGEGAARTYEKLLQSAFTRAIPLAGTSRMINDTIRKDAPEAIGWVDNILRVVPGGGLYLPSRVDALGDPVDGRDFGLAVGMKDGEGDPIRRQLAELQIDINNLQKADPAGFKLTSEELSELRRIRGHEAVNSRGQTMREALGALLNDPWFQSLRTKEQKRDEVIELMSDFNDDARAIFEERNPQYLADVEANKSFVDYMEAYNLEPDEARGMAVDDVLSRGLPEPSRL